MGDKIWHFEDCPNCGGKETLECFEQITANLKSDNCEKCGYYRGYDVDDSGSEYKITKLPPRIPTPPKTKLEYDESIYKGI